MMRHRAAKADSSAKLQGKIHSGLSLHGLYYGLLSGKEGQNGSLRICSEARDGHPRQLQC